jgi:hypothetical protein
MLATVIIIFFIVAFIAANLPWLSERLFGLFSLKSEKKSAWSWRVRPHLMLSTYGVISVRPPGSW